VSSSVRQCLAKGAFQRILMFDQQLRLVQTQKLASLGQLTAGIAHEIKNPLNFVNNFLGCLRGADR
jgi:C4-dicarboxylate-specific signal transduction histidine kinase